MGSAAIHTLKALFWPVERVDCRRTTFGRVKTPAAGRVNRRLRTFATADRVHPSGIERVECRNFAMPSR